MIVLDGSYGEGGGQIVRTAVSLSAYFGIPCRIENIRAKRPNPGLKAQHVAGIKALQKFAGAEVEGLRVGSRTLEFHPKTLKGGSFKLDVGTAGSISLVLQSIMLPASRVPSRLRMEISGGTDVKWSPTITYVNVVLMPLLERMGYVGKLELKKRGYYPKGGGRVLFESRNSNLRGLNLANRGALERIEGLSHASLDLSRRRVAERQRDAALQALQGITKDVHIKVEYVDSASTGSGIDLWAVFSESVLGANALGERGKMAENVGREAAEKLIREIEKGASVDRWAADQIIPFLGVAEGESVLYIAEPTLHLKTNIWVTKKFPIQKEIRVVKETKGLWKIEIVTS